MNNMVVGSGVGEEKASGKVDRVEQVLLPGKELVVALDTRGGVDLLRVEGDKEVETGEDLPPGVDTREDRTVKVEGRDSSRGLSGPGNLEEKKSLID